MMNFQTWLAGKNSVEANSDGSLPRAPTEWSIAKPLVFRYVAAKSRIELTVAKARHLDANQAEALLERLEIPESREALRQRLDGEIEVGLEQLKQGEKFPAEQMCAEIRERSQRRSAQATG